MLLHDKASLNAPYSHASSRPQSLRVFVTSGDEQLRFVRIQQVEDPDLLRVINRNAWYYVLSLQGSNRGFGHLPERVLCRVLGVAFFVRL